MLKLQEFIEASSPNPHLLHLKSRGSGLPKVISVAKAELVLGTLDIFFLLHHK